jgi:hypothetical protein
MNSLSRHSLSRVACLTALVLSLSASAYAQGQTVQIGGQVADDTAAALAAQQQTANAMADNLGRLSGDVFPGADPLETGPQVMFEAKAFTGSALGNSVATNKAQRPAVTLYGALYSFWTNNTGAKELGKAEDQAHADADYNMPVMCRRLDTPASSATASTHYATIDCGPEGGLFASPAATAASGAGATPVSVQSTAATNATVGKAGPGNVYGVTLVATTATLSYIRFYDLATTPACNSSTGFKFSLPIPTNGTSGAGGFPWPATGVAFPTGIAWCITGGGASTDNTNAAAGIIGAVFLK